jgi:glycosyltransferase involved in cell wall biosynthesis
MKNRICCVFNYAPHYREPIFQRMDKELKCDFYFGDTVFMDIKKLDYNKLKGFRGEFKTLKFRTFKWHFGICRVFFRNYSSFIITGDTSYLSNWLVLLYCSIFKRKIFLWCHGLKQVPKEKKVHIERIFFGNKNVEVILYGNYSRNIMIDAGYDKSKLHVIFNSLDYDRQFKIRNNIVLTGIYENHFRNKYPVVLFIGRLEKSKKLELIIESQKLLSDSGIFFNTIFIGSGEMEKLLVILIRKYNLEDRVWFYGPCYKEELIAPLIYNADLTISPGNIGLTAMHSLVYGTPAITHSNFVNQNPEFEAITPGITGDFFEEDNEKDLAMKISSWIKNSQVNREKIRAMCYKMMDSFYNPDYQIKLMIDILK